MYNIGAAGEATHEVIAMEKHTFSPGPDVVDEILDIPPSNTDTFGSNTGKPKQDGEIPVQDADDL